MQQPKLEKWYSSKTWPPQNGQLDASTIDVLLMCEYNLSGEIFYLVGNADYDGAALYWHIDMFRNNIVARAEFFTVLAWQYL